jgi:spore germination protein YaaH
LIRSVIDTKEYTINGEKFEENQKITVANDEDQIFISIDFLEKYCNYEHSLYSDPNRVLIRELGKADKILTVTEHTQIRVLPDVKSEIVVDASKDQELIYLEVESNNWSMVMTTDGYQGYIKNKFIGATETQNRPKRLYEYDYTSIALDGPVSLVWHQVTNTTANNNINELIDETKGVNVVSPTWFSLSNAEGDIKSIASYEYVNTIKQKGMQVWGLVTNQFDRELTRELLSYTSRRDAFVKNIIDLALEYGLNGMNIDFESFNNAEGEAFTELIRELSIQCRKNKLVLSVDIYVPSAWNLFIDRTAIAEVADYIVVMGYDEHWGGGAESGSVSSLGFFEKGLMDTLELVPANKIIMGLPFYTRLWEEVNGAIVSYKAYGMDKAKEIITEQGITPIWDEFTGQNYAEYTIDESIFKVWLEDESSIKERMKVIESANIAGFAAWKLGLESTAVWNVIESYNEK